MIFLLHGILSSTLVIAIKTYGFPCHLSVHSVKKLWVLFYTSIPSFVYFLTLYTCVCKDFLHPISICLHLILTLHAKIDIL